MDNTRRSCVEDTIIRSTGKGFDDIAGLKNAKEILREAIIIPALLPHLFKGEFPIAFQ